MHCLATSFINIDLSVVLLKINECIEHKTNKVGDEKKMQFYEDSNNN